MINSSDGSSSGACIWQNSGNLLMMIADSSLVLCWLVYIIGARVKVASDDANLEVDLKGCRVPQDRMKSSA